MRNNKPSWGTAPDWAQYLAMDDNGKWYWYENAPAWSPSEGHWIVEGFSRYERAEDSNGSLEKRPE